jgi:hypothetical protein
VTDEKPKYPSYLAKRRDTPPSTPPAKPVIAELRPRVMMTPIPASPSDPEPAALPDPEPVAPPAVAARPVLDQKWQKILHGVGASAWPAATSQQVHDRLRTLAADRFAVASTTQMTEREARHLIDEVRAMIPAPAYVVPRTTSFLKLPKAVGKKPNPAKIVEPTVEKPVPDAPFYPATGYRDGYPVRHPDLPAGVPSINRLTDREIAASSGPVPPAKNYGPARQPLTVSKPPVRPVTGTPTAQAEPPKPLPPYLAKRR